jgi:hypothetical protein
LYAGPQIGKIETRGRVFANCNLDHKILNGRGEGSGMAGDESGDFLFGLIAVVLVIGVNIAIIGYMVWQYRRADALCRELLDTYFPRLKMLVPATQVRSAAFNRRGVLVMLDDRLVFRIFRKGEPLELPFAQLRGFTPGKFGIGMIRKLELVGENSRVKFYISPGVYRAWQLALEKQMPASGPQPIG